MDIVKEFVYQLQQLSFVDPFIQIHEDGTPKLKHYVYLLSIVEFVDGSYHSYYGEIKKIVNSFITCWVKTMDEAKKVGDIHAQGNSRDDLMELLETTINVNMNKQIEFARDFLPVKSSREQEVYEEVEEKFNQFMQRLYELREQIKKLDKQDKVEAFAKEHLPITLKKKNEVFLFTHAFISKLLIKHVDRIRISLEELVLRARKNLQKLQEKCISSINSLLQQLYDKNKEHLSISRQDTRSSLDLAEVERSMEIIKDKIEDSKHVPMARLVDEYKYWQNRMVEFRHISDALRKLNEEENNLLEQEKILNNIECPEIFNIKSKCWGETAKSLQSNLKAVREMKTNAAKALMTFFSVKGPDHVIYTDNVGPYYMDDYGHQVYFFDYGLKVFHVNCDGEFVEVKENEKYYYDDMGRYVIDSDGSKLYQIDPCTSTYKLQNDVFVKNTKDCGHSNRDVKGCRMKIKDPNDITILPLVDSANLTDNLDPEVSKYLWDNFGHILPHALRDVAMAQPKNPIHYLAHKLLFHKYSRSQFELCKMKKEAGKYREKLIQNSKDQAIAESKAWKAKQVKRRKPEESDDTLERFAYDAHVAKQDFIRELNFYDD